MNTINSIENVRTSPGEGRYAFTRHFSGYCALLVLGAFSLFFMHVSVTHPGGTGLDLPQCLFAWMLAGLLAILAGAGLFSWRGWRQEGFLLLCLCGSIILSLPWLYAPETWRYLSDLRVAGLWGGILFLLSCRSLFTPRHFSVLLPGLLLTGVVVEAGVGILQASLPQWIPFPLTETSGSRAVGVFSQPNVMASFLGTGVLLSLHLYLRATYQYSRWLLLGATLLLALCLPLTQSTQVWLTLGVAALMVVWSARQWGRGSWLWLVVLVSGVIAGMLLWRYLHGEPLNHETGCLGRLGMWKTALWMIMQKPWLGWGYGHFETAYVSAWMAMGNVPVDHTVLPHPHNELLFWLTEGGAVAGAGLLCLLGAGIVLIRRGVYLLSGSGETRTSALNALSLLSCTLPVLMHTQLEYPLYQSAWHYLIVLLLLSGADICMYGPGTGATKVSKTSFHIVRQIVLRLMLVIAGMGTLIWMLAALNMGMVLTLAENQLSKDRVLSADMQERVAGVHSLTPWVMKERFWRLQGFSLASRIERTGDTEGLHSLIVWEKNYLKRHPDPNVTMLLIMDLSRAGQVQEARDAAARAADMYPWEAAFNTVARGGVPEKLLPDIIGSNITSTAGGKP